MTIDDLTGPAARVTDDDVRRAAGLLGVSVAKVRTVCAVESNGRGFHPETRRPIILFEPHVFHKRTAGAFSVSHPDLSYARWGERPYPATQSQRYAQLATAMGLAESAALESASWGMFQMMGYNSRPAGFESVQGFVRAITHSEGEQIAAFARFVTARPEMLAALQKADWAGFARAYNGPGFAQHGYDKRLKAAFAHFQAAP